MNEFFKFISDIDLVDLPLVRGTITWSNNWRLITSMRTTPFEQIFYFSFLGGSLLYVALEEMT